MIPSVLSTQVRQGVEDFLRTTYPPAEPFFAEFEMAARAELVRLFPQHAGVIGQLTRSGNPATPQ